MSDAPDENVLPPAPPKPRTGLYMTVFLVLVVIAGYSAQHVIEMRHGARWYDGTFVVADFQLPARSSPVARSERVVAPFTLAQGSGSLKVRAALATLQNGARVVRSVRVECGDDVVPGVTARVEVTDYSLRTGDDDRIGHVTLEAVETAADGDHVHHLELRADGLYLDPAAPTPVPRRAAPDVVN